MIPLGILAPSAPNGPWSPASLSGLVSWHDAAEASTITSSAGSVSEWADRSGNGYALGQLTAAAKPTTGTATRNSLNVISFGGNDYVTATTASDWTFLHNGTAVLLGIVAQHGSSTQTILDTGGIDSSLVGTGVTALGGTSSFLNRSAKGSSLMSMNNATGGSSVAPGWHAYTILMDPDNATAAQRSRIWVDSGSTPYANSTATESPSTSSPNGPLAFGYNYSSGSSFNYLSGAIAEVVIAESSSTGDRDALSSYLLDKWGIT